MKEFFVKVVQFLLLDFLFLSPVILVGVIGLAIYFRARLKTIWQKTIVLIVIAILLLTIWGVHIERQLITITNQTINLGFQARIAVISDTHLGLWKNQSYLAQVIEKINQIPNLDAILIPGDWTYYPDIKQLDTIFAPLAQSKYPVYGVLGNHDVERPGPNLRDELRIALEKNKVSLLNNQILTKEATGLKFNIAGLGDRWGGEDYVNIMNSQEGAKTIAITHNPETILKYKSLTQINQPALTVTGHTHCGQVRIPLIYKLAIPVDNKDFDKGLFNNAQFNPDLTGQLWISCGVGEVGLPIRLFNPPSIDILTIN